MSSTETPSAIVRISSPRPDLLAFEICDKIDRASIEDMARQIDQAMDSHATIDVLLIFQGFDGVTVGAAFDGKAAKTSTRSLAHIRRYAVVGAPAWAEAAINLFDPIIPVDARTFEISQRDQAWAWVSETHG